MAINTRNSLDKALKLVYEPGMNYALNKNVVALNAFTKRKFPGAGKAYVFAVHVKRNAYVASRAHDGYYAPAGLETPENGQVVPTNTHIAFEITNDVIKASKGDRAAFKDAMRMVMDTSRETVQTDLNRQFCGDGTGILCKVAADAGGAGTRTLTVQAGFSTKYLVQGMALDFWANAAVTRRNSSGTETVLPTDWMVVGSVLSDTQFTVAMFGGGSVPALTADDWAVRMGNILSVSAAKYCFEANGLALMADDSKDPAGGLHGISNTLYDMWEPIVKDATGADASPGLASATAILFQQRSPFRFSQIWTHPNQSQGLLYGNEGAYKDKRFVNGSVTDIGDDYEAVVINVAGKKVRVMQDHYFDEKVMYFVDPAQLRYVELNGVELEEQQPGQYLVPYRDANGAKPAQVGYWMFRGNWAVVARNSVGRVYNLSQPVSIPW